jgi:hypothetical protein
MRYAASLETGTIFASALLIALPSLLSSEQSKPCHSGMVR